MMICGKAIEVFKFRENALIPGVQPLRYSLFMRVVGINNILNVVCRKVFYTLTVIVFIEDENAILIIQLFPYCLKDIIREQMNMEIDHFIGQYFL